jgi:hypothetical protein
VVELADHGADVGLEEARADDGEAGADVEHLLRREGDNHG